MEPWLVLILLAVGLGGFALYLWAVSWVIFDAHSRGTAKSLPLFLFGLFGPLAVAVWLVVRPSQRLAEKRPIDYADADDALAAAARLDMLGDWEEALALYQTSAQRWSEHRAYIEQCIEQINKKRSRATSSLF